MILTAASDGLFFNQTSIPPRMLVLDAANAQIISINLFVEKNLTINGSLSVYYEHYFIWNTFSVVTSQFKTNFQLHVDGQLLPAEQYLYTWSIINATECFNGTHTFLSMPVNIYITNITGQFRFYLSARIHNQWAGRQYESVAFTARIKNGSYRTLNNIKFITI